MSEPRNDETITASAEPMASGTTRQGQSQPRLRPIWHSPAWLTAIVSVISAFLTVPEVVSDYLTKEQEIAEMQLLNKRELQDQEFEIVHNILAQQGPERIFILRYLSSTLDDEDARNWAANEVMRLDELTSLTTKLANTENQLAEVRGQAEERSEVDATLLAEIGKLQQELAEQQRNIDQKRAEAGIGRTSAVQVARKLSRIIFATVQATETIDRLRKHAIMRGWSDVGGHFLVDAAGEIETGRSLERVPAIARGNNTGSVGIYIACPNWVIYDQRPEQCEFTDAQTAAATRLVSNLSDSHDIPFDAIFPQGELTGRQSTMGLEKFIPKLTCEPGTAQCS